MRTSAAFVAVLSAAAAALAAATPAHAGGSSSCLPPRVMVVLDKSSSMQTGTIDGATKWSIAVDALGDVMMELEDRAEVGLMTFPRPDRCGPGGLDVAPALGTRTAILDALGDPPPTSGNFTPMAQTLEAAAVEPTLIGAEAPRYVVLISDGWQWCSPYDPSTRYDGVDAVGSLNAAGVTTYVVGFGGAADASALNLMAVEAGTARPGCNPANDEPSDPDHCYYQADDAAALVAALQDIAEDVSVETCDGEDNDCDGLIDEGLVRECATACGAGTEACVMGTWEGCDAPAVGTEVCNGLDDDCDGATDPGCDCVPGETRPCGETSDVGACTPGVQTCSDEGTWGGCDGSVGPAPEMCNGQDDDCDGEVDEEGGGSDDVVLSTLCDPGEMCVDGGCEGTDPVTPPTDETDPDSGFDEGGMVAGCGCASGGDGGGALGGLVLMGAVAFAVGRRQRR